MVGESCPKVSRAAATAAQVGTTFLSTGKGDIMDIRSPHRGEHTETPVFTDELMTRWRLTLDRVPAVSLAVNRIRFSGQKVPSLVDRGTATDLFRDRSPSTITCCWGALVGSIDLG